MCADFIAMAEIPDMAPILSNKIKSVSLSKGFLSLGFKSLPTYIKKFRCLLKIFRYSNSVYTLEFYFQYNNT